MSTLRTLRTGVTLRTLGTSITHVALGTLNAGLTLAIQHVAGAVVIHVLGGEVTRAVLVEIPAAHAGVTLRPLSTWVTFGALSTLRTGITLRPLRTGIARVALGPLRAGVTLRTLGTSITRVALGTLNAGLTLAIQHVAGAVVIHVLGGEVTRAVLVEIPAAHAGVTLRAQSAWVPLGALRTLGTGVTLRTLGTAIAGIALRTLIALGTRGTGVPLGPLRTRRTGFSGVALGALRAVDALAIQHAAVTVVIDVLGFEVTLAILVQVPAMQAVRALRTRITCGAPRSHRTSAIENAARPVSIHVLGVRVAPSVGVQIPAVDPVLTLRPLWSLCTVVTLRTLRTGITCGARHAWIALGALRTRGTCVALVTLQTLGTRVTVRALRSARTLAIENAARPVSIHVLGVRVAPSVGVQIPAIDPVRTPRSLRSRSTVVTPRAHQPERSRWSRGPLCAHRSLWAH